MPDGETITTYEQDGYLDLCRGPHVTNTKEINGQAFKLNKIAKTVDRIYLASDPDREGEAIAWHVKECLKFPEDKIFRIVFNEITPNAIKEAVANYHQIDMLKVEAQKTRQILDKLVGFKISPILWETMKNYKLSAGRVQSVALKMICEREDEIEAFVPKEYWSIHALMDKDGKTFEENIEFC